MIGSYSHPKTTKSSIQKNNCLNKIYLLGFANPPGKAGVFQFVNGSNLQNDRLEAGSLFLIGNNLSKYIPGCKFITKTFGCFSIPLITLKHKFKATVFCTRVAKLICRLL